MKKRYWILLTIAGIVIIAMSAYHYIKLPKRGDLAPSFSLKETSGKIVSLDEYRGKIVLLHFWASWCNVCRYELPAVERLYNQFKDKGLVVLSILEEEDLSLNDAVRLKKTFALTLPVLLDDNAEVADKYMSYGVPESFIIGRDGVILERIPGAVNWNDAAKTAYFNKLLYE